MTVRWASVFIFALMTTICFYFLITLFIYTSLLLSAINLLSLSTRSILFLSSIIICGSFFSFSPYLYDIHHSLWVTLCYFGIAFIRWLFSCRVILLINYSPKSPSPFFLLSILFIYSWSFPFVFYITYSPTFSSIFFATHVILMHWVPYPFSLFIS